MYERRDVDSGPGWKRIKDEDDAAEDYGLPRDDHGNADGWYNQPGEPNPAIQQIIRHPEAPYGWDEAGVPLDKDGWNARYALPDSAAGGPGGVFWGVGNGGAVPGSRVQYDDLESLLRDYPEFQQLDRIGGTGGAYLTVRGTPFEQRGLTPGHATSEDFLRFDLGGDLPPHIKPEVSVIAPANGFPGGGWQLRFFDTSTNEWMSVADLGTVLKDPA